MVPRRLTCPDVAYVYQRCRRLHTLVTLGHRPQCRRRIRGSQPMSNGTSNPARYFGRQVRRARRAAGWTLTELGQRIGYDPGQISRIENGKRPPTELFARMCDEAFPDLGGWFSEFYAESRTWIATPPWFRSWV